MHRALIISTIRQDVGHKDIYNRWGYLFFTTNDFVRPSSHWTWACLSPVENLRMEYL